MFVRNHAEQVIERVAEMLDQGYASLAEMRDVSHRERDMNVPYFMSAVIEPLTIKFFHWQKPLRGAEWEYGGVVLEYHAMSDDMLFSEQVSSLLKAEWQLRCPPRMSAGTRGMILRQELVRHRTGPLTVA